MTGSIPHNPGSALTGKPTVGTEIERKFLVRDTGVVAGISGKPLVQGYFADIDGWSIRLRTTTDRNGDGRAWLTLKSPEKGATRREIEAEIDHALATKLLSALPPDQLISKIRYRVPVAGAADVPLSWEIDRFLERHHGLWLAEVELPRADYPVTLPDWLGPEVTDDPRYRNAALSRAAGPSPQSSAGMSLPVQAAPVELVAMVRGILAGSGIRPAGDMADGVQAGA